MLLADDNPSKLSRDEGVLAVLLIVGLYFPTSIGGEYLPIFYQVSLLGALSVLLYLISKRGARPGAGTYLVLPVLLLLTASTFSTLLTHSFPIGWGTLLEYILLVLVLSLDLRGVVPGPFMRRAFVIANVVGIGCGILILIGNETFDTFLSTFYAYFYAELVPNMLRLHKPVLTFGTHSLAGFFLYLFFWLNWENYNARRTKLALCGALSWLILLLAVASVTALALASLAFAQIGVWLWKRNRKAFAAAALVLFVGLLAGGKWLEDYFEITEPMELVSGFFGNEVSGPVARYGPGGSERGRIEYLVNRPFAPIGVAAPVFAATVDSAPIDYLLRGSVPLLVLLYFGVFRFARHNLTSRTHALTLFFVIVGFEVGFTVLSYFRTFYLLPLVVVYLNNLSPVDDRPAV